jgi:hypothetical protein
MERYPNGSRAALEHKRHVIDREFEEALVTGYESLIDEIKLPDRDDQHILAAARACGADVIVTENISDFPAVTLAPLGMTAERADDFICDQVGLAAESTKMVAIAVVRHKKSLTKSRLTWEQYFSELTKKLPHSFVEFDAEHFRQAITEFVQSREFQMADDILKRIFPP